MFDNSTRNFSLEQAPSQTQTTSLTSLLETPTKTHMVASALLITDLKGKVIISRDYRGDCPLSLCAFSFSSHLSKSHSDSTGPSTSSNNAVSNVNDSQAPIFRDEHGISYVYHCHANLYFLMVSKNKNADVLLQYTFIFQLLNLFTLYFTTICDESIRDNFIIIYELLDEVFDFGYPQVLEAKILKEYITQSSNKLETPTRPPVALTNAVSWRSEGIKYKKNEIYLDVIERLNLLVSSSGAVLNEEILGVVRMKSYLSGMPELKLGLNDKVMFDSTGRSAASTSNSSGGKSSTQKSVNLEDVKFHQCVRLARFSNDRTISFIPPDGEFDLMTYRLPTSVKPLIWCEAVVESYSHSRIEYLIKTKSQFKSRSIANSVTLIIPVPGDVDSPSFKTSIGTVTYLPDQDAICWTIKQFHGGREYILRAHFGLPSISADDSKNSDTSQKEGIMSNTASWKKPIQVKFEIPYFTVSGIQVRYLKIIEKSGYSALPWVRYITQNGDYSLRMA